MSPICPRRCRRQTFAPPSGCEEVITAKLLWTQGTQPAPGILSTGDGWLGHSVAVPHTHQVKLTVTSPSGRGRAAGPGEGSLLYGNLRQFALQRPPPATTRKRVPGGDLPRDAGEVKRVNCSRIRPT